MRYLITLALLVPLAVNAAGIHKWVDADGNVSYGDTPPPNAQSQNVRVQSPPSNPGRSLPRLGTQGEQEAESAGGGEPETASSSSNDPNEIACTNARQDLRVINRSTRIKLRTSDGEERYLTPEEIAERKTRAEADIEQYRN